MAVVRKPKHFVEKSIWTELSEKLGDFIEENLWGGKGEKGAEFFKRKYGEDWEEKRESSRKGWRTLSGLLPAKDANMFEMALAVAPIFGTLSILHRGAIAGLRRQELAKFIKGISRDKAISIKGDELVEDMLEEELRFMGGGEFKLGAYAQNPLYTTFSKGKAAFYPTTKAGASAPRDIYKFGIEDETLRKTAIGFSRYDRSIAYNDPAGGWNVYQELYNAPLLRSVGRPTMRTGPRLEAVFPRGLRVKDVTEFGRWENVRFPHNQDPYRYFEQTGQYLEPALGDAVYRDLLPLVRKLRKPSRLDIK